MPRANVIQTNFTAGEISPLMLGRSDTTKYQNGAALIKNFYVRQQGGLWRRQGSQYFGDVKDTGGLAVLLKDFTFSDDQQYVIEFGELYFRVWNNFGVIIDTTPVGIATPAPLEVATPYHAYEVGDLRFTQSADIIYIAHPDHQPMKLERFGEFDWRLVALVNTDGPYMSFNDTGATLQVSQVHNNALLTATANIFSAFTPTYAVTGVTNVGGLIKLTVTAHGYGTNDNVIVYGLALKQAGVTQVGGADNPHGNGQYTIDVVDANHFTLRGSIYSVYDLLGSDPAPVYDTTNAFVRRLAAAPAPYVEYRLENTYRLAYMWNVITAKTANVYVDLYMKLDVASNTTISFDGTFATSNYGGTFTQDDIGRYVRMTNGSWVLIYSYVSDSKVGATQVTLTSTAGVTVTISNVVRTAYIYSDIPVFSKTDVGRHLRMNFNGSQTWGIITVVYGTGKITINLKEPMPFSGVYGNYAYFEYGGTTFLWKFGAWSDTTGYPHVVCFHEQRLTFMNTRVEPQTIWMSKSADYENFAPTELSDSSVLSSSAITATLTSAKSDPILWAISGVTLLIGTLGNEFQCKASTTTVALSPTDFGIYPQTNYGSSRSCAAFKVGYAAIFVQRSGMKVMELYYDFTIDSYVGKNCNVVNDHILRQGGGAIRTAFQQEPNNTIWCLLKDGTLAAMTYERTEQVYAWHRHILGGGATVESICSIKAYDGAEDRLWMVVSRTLNGNLVKSIEVFGTDFYPTSSQDKVNIPIDRQLTQHSFSGIANNGGYMQLIGVSNFPAVPGDYVVTSGITISQAVPPYPPGTPYGNGRFRIVSISGNNITIAKGYSVGGTYSFGGANVAFYQQVIPPLMTFVDRWTFALAGDVVNKIITVDSRYNGTALQVIVDGSLLGLITVSGSQIVLPTAPITCVLYGFPYQSLLQVLPLEGGSASGNSQGKIKKVASTEIRLFMSLGFKYGSDLSKMVYRSFRDSADVMNSSPPFLTGDYKVQMPMEFNRTGQFYITQDEPYPLNILALMPDVNTYE